MEVINLFREPKRFLELPGTVQKGIIALIGAWVGHFYFYFRFADEYLAIFKEPISEEMLFKQIAIAVVTIYFVLLLRNWARILCILGNLLVVVPYFLYLYISLAAPKAPMALKPFAAINIGLFTLASVFLLLPKSSAFFKIQSQPPKE